MPYDMNQLTEALRAKAAGQGQMAALKPQVASAQALQAAPDNYENPWAALGGVLDRSRGNREMTALQPLLTKARGQVAGGENAVPLYNAQVGADKTTYDRSRIARDDLVAAEQTEYDRKAPARALKKARAEREMKSKDLAGTGTTYANPDGSDPVVTYNMQGKIVNDRGEPVNLAGKVPYSDSGSGGGSRGANAAGFRAPTAAQQTDIEEGGQAADKIFKVAGSFNDAYANPAGGLPFAGDISNYLAAEAPFFTTKDAEMRQKWWSDFKQMYELVERHGLFGAALTKPEIAQWRQATITPNMTPDQIKAKLKTLEDITRAKMQSVGQSGIVKGWNPDWLTMHTGVKLPEGDSAIPATDPTVQLRPSIDLNVVPQGEDPAEWGALSEQQRSDYHQYVLGGGQ